MTTSWCLFWALIVLIVVPEIRGQSVTDLEQESSSTSSDYTETTTNDDYLTTNSYDSTTCTANGSCGLTTPKSTTQPTVATTTTGSKNVTTINPFIKRNTSISRNRTSWCNCNLQLNYCDINCCCDKDCNYEDKMVFEKCNNVTYKHETPPFCNNRINNFDFHLDNKWWIFDNNFLCIKRSNMPEGHNYKEKKALRAVEILQPYYKDDQPYWPNTDNVVNINFNESFSEKLKFGGNVWLLKNNEIVSLVMSDSFITSACLIKKDVKYLVDDATKCSLTSVDNDNPNIHAETFYKHFEFISSPKAFTVLWDRKKQPKCPKNICIFPKVSICDESFESCKDKLISRGNCSYYYRENLMTCKNIVKKINYEIFHKGQEGIVRVNLKINLQNFSYSFGSENVDYFQEFSVKFYWHNYKLNYSNLMSGNPGYLVGKPILVTRLNGTFNFSEIDNVNMSLSVLRNDTFYSENFLVFPSFNHKRCVLNNRDYTPVEFGYNTILKCRIEEEIVFKNKSASEICRNMQKIVFQFWSVFDNNNTTRVFGKYGNSDRTKSSDWISGFFAKNITTATYGNFTKNNETLLCSNLNTKVRINIFHSRIDFDDAQKQEIVLGILYNFTGIRKDLEYRNWNNKSVKFSIPIVMEVVFHDITPKSDQETMEDDLVSLETKNLPHEFFYSLTGVVKNKAGENFVLDSQFALIVIHILILVFN